MVGELMRGENKKYTKEEMIGALRSVLDDENKSFQYYDENRKEEHPNPVSIRNRFGYWNVALNEAGLADREVGEKCKNTSLRFID